MGRRKSTSSIKRPTRMFHVVVVQWTFKKCTEKRDLIKTIFFQVVVVVVVVA